MLAHHPHTWDPAVAHGIPLVLAGHTHGGQVMLTNSLGAGPLRFNYWSGVYEREGSTLLVSNGVGNWFPLRVNAPAEINHITLHPAST
jgi:predicted MPP superfamily phosphohydrolase